MTRRGFLSVAAAGVTNQYPLYRARGTHRELGRQHGEQASAKIKAHLDYIASSAGLSMRSLEGRALRFEPLFRRHAPHLMEEIRGLGEGAGIPKGAALAVNIRGELASARSEGCTAYAVRQGEILIGQNSDINESIPPLGYVLHLEPAGKPAVLIWTFGGMIGYHGINSKGIGHFANALGGGPANRFALPHYPVKRLMLECRTADEAVALLRTVPLASNGNYVLCDARKILDVEATTAGAEVLGEEGPGYLAHTNHFVCARHATKANFAKSWRDSFPRLDRMNALLAARAGQVTVEDLKRYLSDHEGHPSSICRHGGENSTTVASLIAEPNAGRMHVALGNPCRNGYVTYSL